VRDVVWDMQEQEDVTDPAVLAAMQGVLDATTPVVPAYPAGEE
jgi:hypothetical protein